MLSFRLLALPLLLSSCAPLSPAEKIASGTWRCTLDCPGGPMPFGLEVQEGDGGTYRASIVNGAERIPIHGIAVEGEEGVLEMPHYDSRLRFKILEEGHVLEGDWEKRRGSDDWGRMAFRAVHGETRRFLPGNEIADSTSIAGRWAVDFASDELPAVAIFEETGNGNEVTGTFLTATGDYRYLAGVFAGDLLRLSVFDGAHAFLFHARRQEDGTLAGDFWSGNWYHETWTARRDEAATLGDAFAQTTWLPGASLADLVLPDLEGRARSLVDAEFAGKAIVLQLFGSWCPNCHDETAYLARLYEKYADRGLVVLGLAFELTGEFDRDAAQVKTFVDKYDVGYPMFLAGVADKTKATEAFPLVDRVRSFPTTIFLTGDGNLHSVHSGFVGPATGDAHDALRRQFESTIEELLAAPAADDAATWSALAAHQWWSWVEFAGATYDFALDGSAARTAKYALHGSGVPVIREEILPVRIVGDAVWIGEQVFRFDPVAEVLQHPTRFAARLTRYHFTESSFLDGRGYAIPAGLVPALGDSDPRVRREAVWELTRQRAPHAESTLPEMLPLLDDPDLEVRRAAVWAFAECQDHSGLAAVLALREHPNAALRREVTSALVHMSKKRGVDLRDALVPLAKDPDPLVRERALAGLAEKYRAR